MRSVLENRKKLGVGLILVFLLAALGVGFLATSLQTASGPQQMDRTTSYSGNLGATEADYGSRVEDSGGSVVDFEDRKRSTTMDVDLKVEDISKAQESIISLVEGSNGYVTSTRFDSRESSSGSLRVKIPDSNSDNFTSQLESLGKVESKSTDVQDLTDQYDEVETELESRKKELQRLEELINSTENVSDLIEIQERLSDVRSRIDYLEQRKSRLDNRVSYTEINIQLSEPTPFNADFEPRQVVTDAYKAFFQSIGIIIIGLGYLSPLALLGGIVYGLVSIKRRYSEDKD